jgi:hypothetical protein
MPVCTHVIAFEYLNGLQGSDSSRLFQIVHFSNYVIVNGDSEYESKALHYCAFHPSKRSDKGLNSSGEA